MTRLPTCARVPLGALALCLGLTLPGRAADVASRRIEEIRQRLRAEAGMCETGDPEATLPMVSITVLPGDSHRRLALELTGAEDAAAVLRSIEPSLTPGQPLFLPRALLMPQLSDPRRETLRLGDAYPTLWAMAKGALRAGPGGVPAAARTLQRINGIADPTRLGRGAPIEVPRGLLAEVPARAPAPLQIRRTYRVTDLKGLDRQVRPGDLPRVVRSRLQAAGTLAAQLGERPVDLVVIHTTEHRGAPFRNVARYLQRKRLANYLIGPDGGVYEVVPEGRRSHGCGQSLWEGHYEVDHGAINVEIFADTAPGEHRRGIAAAQYRALRALLDDLQARRPEIHPGRVVTHRMVAVSYSYGTRSRKGDPYEFDWASAGLPDNSQAIDQDVLLGRTSTCTDRRYADRVTDGQAAAQRMLHNL